MKDKKTFRVYRQDINEPRGFAYLGKFTGDKNMSAKEQIDTAKAMYPLVASPVVAPEM